MRHVYQHIITASVILGMGLGLSGLQAAAEEASNESTAAVVAAVTAAPTALPTATPGATAPCFTKYQEHKYENDKPKERELELNWNVAIGTATYSENDESYNLSGTGIMLEINPGMNVITAPGLDIGMAVGFLMLMSDASFNVDYEGPPVYTRNWEVSAMSVGTYIMTKYSYDFDLGFIKLGLENGLGLGYFINSVSADWIDANDDNIRGDNSQDENGWAPIVRAGLKIVVPVTEVSCLGINAGANLIPLIAGDYSNFITISAGLNYQVKY